MEKQHAANSNTKAGVVDWRLSRVVLDEVDPGQLSFGHPRLNVP